MPLINKLSSGRIYSDEFTSVDVNPIWQVSPTDPSRYSLTDREGYLRLKHGDAPLYLLMDMPNKDFVFEIKNDYLPTQVGDSAGIVVYRDASSRIELLEYFDSRTRTVAYTHMRVQRKGEVYTGYGSEDDGRTWKIIGSGTAQGMTKIGLVINGLQATGVKDFDVDYVKVFEDNKFIVGNLSPGMKVELLDENNNLLDSRVCPTEQDHIYIETVTLPSELKGRIRISEGGEIIETSDLMTIWGGDVFWYGLIVEVLRNGDLLPKDTETPLGHMINGLIEAIVSVRNPGSDPLPNVKVSRSKYFDHRGHEWVKLAEDIGGFPGDYKDEVFIGTIFPGEEYKIWIKITKEYTSHFALVGSNKFLLEVTS